MSRPPAPYRRLAATSSASSQDHLALLGRRLAGLRAAQGLERAELARRVGITGSRIKKIEEGDGRLEASLLYALVSELNVKVADIFDDSANPSEGALDPETQDLMRFFGGIRDAGIRRSILKLAKALAEKP